MIVYRYAIAAGMIATLGTAWSNSTQEVSRSPARAINLLAEAGAIPARLISGDWRGPPTSHEKMTDSAGVPAPAEPANIVVAELPPPAPAPGSRLEPDVVAPGAALEGTLPGVTGPVRLGPEVASPTASGPRLSPPELSRFAAAAALYRKGDEAAGDAVAAQISDPLQRAGLEWIALKSAPSPDHDRLLAFETAHEDWPAANWIHEVREGWLYNKRAPAAFVDALFADDPPLTPAGVVALARARQDAGRETDAADLVRKLWRDWDLDFRAEAAVLKEFGGVLTRADHKYRADRLLYAEHLGPALRAAALAGPDEVALANARIEAMRGALSARAIAAVPASLQSDPGLLFARVQDARRANRTGEAAAWLASAPHESAALIDPDKWWTERRMVAREFIDRGDYKQAYDLCDAAPTVSVPARVDAAFHAGWIALRLLNDPPAAARHFADAGAVAITPLAVARANYWQGRAADVRGRPDDARRFYERAAAYPIAYYGQLAARRLGRDDPATPRAPGAIASGDERWEATRIVELYYEAGLDDFAPPLAFAAASVWSDEAQLAALGEVLQRRADATVNTDFGKFATERGFALDESAFPTTGLPSFSPLPRSADIASVLAVARQESVFAWRAASGAGAKGLMQILPATAAMTARHVGVAYDYSRLVSDSAYNLRLGAAYLGQLIDDEGGSIEMALAAYNAGPGRVQQWVAAHGDPRVRGADDLVDWVELIPFDETRDYVERVMENLWVYRARLAGATPTVAQAARVARE